MPTQDDNRSTCESASEVTLPLGFRVAISIASEPRELRDEARRMLDAAMLVLESGGRIKALDAETVEAAHNLLHWHRSLLDAANEMDAPEMQRLRDEAEQRRHNAYVDEMVTEAMRRSYMAEFSEEQRAEMAQSYREAIEARIERDRAAVADEAATAA